MSNPIHTLEGNKRFFFDSTTIFFDRQQVGMYRMYLCKNNISSKEMGEVKGE
jgi:hypothetical protein